MPNGGGYEHEDAERRKRGLEEAFARGAATASVMSGQLSAEAYIERAKAAMEAARVTRMNAQQRYSEASRETERVNAITRKARLDTEIAEQELRVKEQHYDWARKVLKAQSEARA